MKKVLLSICACASVLFAVTSCTKESKTQALLGQIPDDMDMVMVGDVKAIMESAGFTVDGQVVKLPAYLTDILDEDYSEDVDEAKAFLKQSGIEVEACAITMNYKDDHPIVVFALSDPDKFRKAIKDIGFKEKANATHRGAFGEPATGGEDEGVTYYTKLVYESSYDPSYNDYGYVAVNGKYAYWIDRVWVDGSKYDAIKTLGRMISEAKDRPFSMTAFSKYITSGNAAGAAYRVPQGLRRDMMDKGFPPRMVEMLDGVLCLRADIGTGEAKVSMKFYDEEGNPKKAEDFGSFFDLKAKVNPEVLAYIDKDECLVCALSLKDVDWDGFTDMMTDLTFDQQARMAAATAFLGKLDGTIALGIGLDAGLWSLRKISKGVGIMDELPLTLVCETKEGKAKELIGDLKGMMETLGVDYESTALGLTLNLPAIGTLYAEAKDDALIISNCVISKKNSSLAVQSVDFGKSICTAAIALGKDNRLLRDLGVHNGLRMAWTYDAEASETSLTLGIDGDEGTGIVERMARAYIDLASHAYELQGMMDYDELECDTVAVDDDWY